MLNTLANGKIQSLFKAFECFQGTFQGKFYFQGHFKTVVYIQVLFKPVRTLEEDISSMTHPLFLWHLIWVCTVCPHRIKRMLGLYEFELFSF